MKQLATLLGLACVLTSAAQPTFQYANFPTTPMEFGVYVMVDAGGTTDPTNGADQTWEYSAMSWLLTATAVTGPASETPYADDYPDANIAWAFTPTLGATEYQYFAVDPTGFEMVASEVPGSPEVFTDHRRSIQFPLSLGGAFTDTYASNLESGTETWTFDGYGTFITTEGTFTDQIKMTSSNNEVIIWNASPIYPTFLSSDAGVFLFVASPNGVEDHLAEDPAHLFPSPCSDELTAEGLEAGPWRIMDASGRTLLSGNSDGSTVQHINVSALSSGPYVLIGDRRPLRFVKR